ncbi:MAG: MarR family winged helix-turn-helix transcriptional regulator [Chloroflexota bacterium]
MAEPAAPIDGPRQTLTTLFLRAAHAMVDELAARIHAAGYSDIRPADSRVFENLDPQGTRLTELAARAQMTHQSMSELVAGLEARGYLERQPDPTDKRARLVRLTPRGRELLHIALAELAEIEGAWLRRLSHDAEPDLRSALSRAVEAEGTKRRQRTTADHSPRAGYDLPHPGGT